MIPDTAGARRLSTTELATTNRIEYLRVTKAAEDKEWVRTNLLGRDGEASEADGVRSDGAFDGT